MQELCCVFEYEVVVLQATIGIDFLSKTMYLEDRTVSPASHCPSQLLHHHYKSSRRHIHIIPLAYIYLTFTIPPSISSTLL